MLGRACMQCSVTPLVWCSCLLLFSPYQKLGFPALKRGGHEEAPQSWGHCFEGFGFTEPDRTADHRADEHSLPAALSELLSAAGRWVSQHAKSALPVLLLSDGGGCQNSFQQDSWPKSDGSQNAKSVADSLTVLSQFLRGEGD